jgi:hypothetical protein
LQEAAVGHRLTAAPRAARDPEPAAIPALSLPPDGRGKLLLPGRPAHALFAAFKHIHLIPDWSLEQGIPLYKLAILDNLIERLAAANGGRSSRTEPASPNTIDSVIAGLAGRLRAQAASTPSYLAGNLPDTGLVVDLVA